MAPRVVRFSYRVCCSFVCSLFFILFYLTGDNKYTHPPIELQRNGGASWVGVSEIQVCVCIRILPVKMKQQPPADTFCFLCCFIGWDLCLMYFYSHFLSGYILFILEETQANWFHLTGQVIINISQIRICLWPKKEGTFHLDGFSCIDLFGFPAISYIKF